MAAAAILDCQIHKISFADGVWGDIAIFRIFKIATDSILDVGNHKIYLAVVVGRVEAHQRAKFRQNRSIGSEDIKIFRFFKMVY